MKIEQIVLFVSTKPGFSQVFARNPEDFDEMLNKRIEVSSFDRVCKE